MNPEFEMNERGKRKRVPDRWHCNTKWAGNTRWTSVRNIQTGGRWWCTGRNIRIKTFCEIWWCAGICNTS